MLANAIASAVMSYALALFLGWLVTVLMEKEGDA